MGEATSDGANAGPSIRICLVGEVVDDQDTITAAKHFKVPILSSETGEEYALDKDQWTTYFILKDFEGPMFEALSKSPNKYVRLNFQIIINPCLIECRFAESWARQLCSISHGTGSPCPPSPDPFTTSR